MESGIYTLLLLDDGSSAPEMSNILSIHENYNAYHSMLTWKQVAK